jgi:hypothetical protein
VQRPGTVLAARPRNQGFGGSWHGIQKVASELALWPACIEPRLYG